MVHEPTRFRTRRFLLELSTFNVDGVVALLAVASTWPTVYPPRRKIRLLHQHRSRVGVHPQNSSRLLRRYRSLGR